MGIRAQPASFADLLQRYRRAAGLTQEELAERAHLSVRGISNLERGVRRLPQRGTVSLLAEALALSATERAHFEAVARGLAQQARGEGLPVQLGGAPAIGSVQDASEQAAGQGRYVDRSNMRVTPEERTDRRGSVIAEPDGQPSIVVPTNLPLALTSFVGRKQEMVTVRRLLGQARLLTLTGTGGCGKTRLAIETAGELSRDALQATTYADGIWLVELAALSTAALVPLTVATVLGLRERPDHSPLDSLTEFLHARRILVLLDNCEHLLAACAQLAETLLRVCPSLTILATSREALGIRGERAWRVPSLGLPDPQGAAGEAVELFCQLAGVACGEFSVTGDAAAVVAQICRRLDGLPLAIELAAARLSALSLDQLATRLDERFRLLTGGSRTALPRQQTLRATLDWSYDLLGGPERMLLRRLTVFAGGWMLEAAEAVCADDGIASEDVLDLLAGLVAKSLVVMDAAGTGVRYRLLETVRQYAREQLVAAQGEAVVRDRHLAWYLALAGQAVQRIGGGEREVWLARLQVELENIRSALKWSSLAVGRLEAGLRLAAALEDFWYIRGYAGEGRRWLAGLLERGGAAVPAAVRARALEVQALLTYYQHEYAQAIGLFEAAHTLHISQGNAASAIWMLNYQGLIAAHLGEYERATMLLEQVLPVHREQGDMHGVAWALSYLGWIHHLQGDNARAAALHGESLVAFEELGDKLGIGYQLGNLGTVARDQGDYGLAKSQYRESLFVRRALMDKLGVALSFEGLGLVAAAEGEPERAARLLSAAHCLREAIGTPLDLLDRTAHERVMPVVRTTLGEELFAAAWAEGRAMPLEVVIASALEVPSQPKT